MRYPLLAIVLLTLCGCSNDPEKAVEVVRPPKNDFLKIDSGIAISNAIRFQKPPPGWQVVCDSAGRFCPSRIKSGTVFDAQWSIRTNRIEAIAAAWRIQAIWDEPPNVPITTNLWHPCDE